MMMSNGRMSNIFSKLGDYVIKTIVNRQGLRIILYLKILVDKMISGFFVINAYEHMFSG